MKLGTKLIKRPIMSSYWVIPGFYFSPSNKSHVQYVCRIEGGVKVLITSIQTKSLLYRTTAFFIAFEKIIFEATTYIVRFLHRKCISFPNRAIKVVDSNKAL